MFKNKFGRETRASDIIGALADQISSSKSDADLIAARKAVGPVVAKAIKLTNKGSGDQRTNYDVERVGLVFDQVERNVSEKPKLGKSGLKINSAQVAQAFDDLLENPRQ